MKENSDLLTPEQAATMPPDILRLEYAAVCRALASPLEDFLDHPLTPRHIAGQISDLIGGVYHSDDNSGCTEGSFANDCLNNIANSHHQAADPDWLRPLTFLLARAFEYEQVPVDFYNRLTDAVHAYVNEDGASVTMSDMTRDKLASAVRDEMVRRGRAAKSGS